MKFKKIIIISLMGFLLFSCSNEEKEQTDNSIPVKTRIDQTYNNQREG